MHKVTLVSLGGNTYQLEEEAHVAVAAYLDRASRALAANPDRAEILVDPEHDQDQFGADARHDDPDDDTCERGQQ